MSIFTQAVYLFALCWLLAQVEIQIEGPCGWAEKLPTWRVSKPWILKLTNGKPMTGYHTFLFFFVFLFFQLPVLFLGFSRKIEAQILSMYFLTTFVWDFQWFVWNPGWGIKRFLREPIWWFPKKIIGFPLEYYTGAAASFAATAILFPALLRRWFALCALLLGFNVATLIAAGILARSRKNALNCP